MHSQRIGSTSCCSKRSFVGQKLSPKQCMNVYIILRITYVLSRIRSLPLCVPRTEPSEAEMRNAKRKRCRWRRRRKAVRLLLPLRYIITSSSNFVHLTADPFRIDGSFDAQAIKILDQLHASHIKAPHQSQSMLVMARLAFMSQH